MQIERPLKFGRNVGEVFDSRFELLESLGSGGIGVVFKAKQLDCDRIVAVKILHEHTALDGEFISRFTREAKALSRLSHKNIVSVYHMGVTGLSVPYIAMEYLEGKSLKQLIRDSVRLPTLKALAIARDVARALSYVHKEGIIHRDLKPENIIICQQPEPDTVKLIDFGLVHLMQNADQKLTETAALIGTPDYMSPEQCLGKEISTSSDIYSLTACLYETLTGKKPFIADGSVAVLCAHVQSPVPKLMRKDVQHFHPCLEELISKGLAKEPGDRFASMDEFASSLDQAIELVSTAPALGRASNSALFPTIMIAFLLLLLSISCFWLGRHKNLETDKMQHSSFKTVAKDLLALKQRMNSDSRVARFLDARRAMEIVCAQNGEHVVRATKLGVYCEYARELKSQDLPAQSLAVWRAFLADIAKNGYPDHFGDSQFNPWTMGQANMYMAEILLDFGEVNEARPLLHDALRQLGNRRTGGLAEQVIRLRDKKQVDLLSEQQFGDKETLAFAAPELIRAGEYTQASRAIDGINSSIKNSLSSFSLSFLDLWLAGNRALLSLIGGDKVATLKKLDSINLDSIKLDSLKPRDRTRLGIVADVYGALGRFDEEKRVISKLFPGELPDSHNGLSSKIPAQDEWNDADASGKQRLLAQLENAINGSTSKVQRIHLLLLRSEHSGAEQAKRLYIFLAQHECQTGPADEVPANLRMACTLQYAHVLDDVGLLSAALEEYRKVIAAETPTTWATNDRGSYSYFTPLQMAIDARSYAASLLLDLGETQKAAEILSDLPAPGKTSDIDWEKLLSAELRLGNDDKARKLVLGCDAASQTFVKQVEVLIHCHKLDIALDCIDCGRKRLRRETRPPSRYYELMTFKFAMQQAHIYEEWDKLAEAQQAIASVAAIKNHVTSRNEGMLRLWQETEACAEPLSKALH